MAGTIKKVRVTGRPGSDVYELSVQFNALVTKFDAVLAKLDADAGVTDTTYASLHGVTVCQIGDAAGTAVA